MVHAVTILGIILVAAPLARFIPMAVLSAVLVVVALNMGEWSNFARLNKWPGSDAVVFVATFVLTVLTDITVAVEVGMVLAAMLFIKRIAETTKVTAHDEQGLALPPKDSVIGKEVPAGALVFQLSGAFLFGTADKLENTLLRTREEPRVLILGMRGVMAMDATGVNALSELHVKMTRRGRQLVLASAHTQPLLVMRKDGLLSRIGEENVCDHVVAALERARVLLGIQTPTTEPVVRS